MAAMFIALLSLSTQKSFGHEPAAESLPIKLKVGDDYDAVRERLLNSGWEPIPEKCSPDNLCLSETPELATDVKSFSTCGLFSKEGSLFRICVRPISDGLKVKSFVNVR